MVVHVVALAVVTIVVCNKLSTGNNFTEILLPKPSNGAPQWHACAALGHSILQDVFWRYLSASGATRFTLTNSLKRTY